jgi:hypothetical protein
MKPAPVPPPFHEAPADWFGRAVWIAAGFIAGAVVVGAAMTLKDPASAKVRQLEASTAEAELRARQAEGEAAAIRGELHEAQDTIADAEVMAASQSPTAEQLVESPESFTEVTASNLLAECRENELAAEAHYSGKRIIIHGTIDSVGRDLLGSPYVIFAGDDDSVGQVQCMFDDAGALAHLRKGSGASIAGELSGVTLNVIVRNCRLVK